VLELLLSQERVISLLYARTFPVGNRSSSKTPFGVLDVTGVQESLSPVQLNEYGSSENSSNERRGNSAALSVSEGGGGPLIQGALEKQASQLDNVNSTKLPSI
jgi:hypothetical protein